MNRHRHFTARRKTPPVIQSIANNYRRRSALFVRGKSGRGQKNQQDEGTLQQKSTRFFTIRASSISWADQPDNADTAYAICNNRAGQAELSSSLTARKASPIAASVCGLAAESALAIAIRPRRCRPITAGRSAVVVNAHSSGSKSGLYE